MSEANVSESLAEKVEVQPEGESKTEPVKTEEPKVTANGELETRQTRNWRALERDRDHWREMAMRQQAPPPAPSVPETEGKTLADFNYDEAKYQAYLFQTAEHKAVSAAEKRLKEQSEWDAFERRKQSFKSHESKFAESKPDYYEVTRNENLAISVPMLEAIAESEDGPALAYHLGKNQDLAERLAEMNPFAAARELGRIEARLANEREKAKISEVTKTPPPPPKVDGADSGTRRVSTTDPESDKLTDEEWVKAETERLARKARKKVSG